jgi:hypothetical protein
MLAAAFCRTGDDASISFGRGAAARVSGCPPPASRSATYLCMVFGSHPANCAAEYTLRVRSYDSKISMIADARNRPWSLAVVA